MTSHSDIKEMRSIIFRTSIYPWYVVGVLMVAYLIAFLDRQIIGLIVQPLKRDLLLSDTQISLLQGLAFAILYTTLGLPIGRLADSTNRRNLIIYGIASWSSMVALCGIARNFGQLFAARIGVGIGEAALSPAAYAMIAEYFSERQLGRAMSFYSLGGFLGLGLSLVGGGALVSLVEKIGSVRLLGMRFGDWQLIFLILSTLGILGVALMLTVREPITNRDPTRGDASIIETMRHLRTHWWAFLSLLGGFSCFILISSGMIAWAPSILIRGYGWKASAAGYGIGTTALVASSIGVLLGGAVNDRAIGLGIVAAPVYTGAFSALGLTAAMGALAVAGTASGVILALAAAYFFLSLPLGVAPAAVQMIAPSAMRSQLGALYLSSVNLIGLGIGPTAVAICTDLVFGNESRVQASFAITGLIAMPLSALLLFGGRNAFCQAFEDVKAGQINA